MAQFYYDLSIVKMDEATWPYFAKGNRPDKVPMFGLGKTFINAQVPAFLFQQALDGDGSHRFYSLGLSLQNFELLFKWRFLKDSTSNFVNTGPCVALRVQDAPGSYSSRPQNCYYAGTGSGGTATRAIVLYKVQGGTQTQLENISSYLPSANMLLVDGFTRISVNGSSIKAKAWLSSDSEPVAWAYEKTDTSIAAAGDIAIACHQYGLAMAQYFVSIGTDGDPAPMEYPGGPRQVVGTVRKPDDTPAAGYIVRCYHRPTGSLLGETITDVNGGFVFPINIPETEQIYCLAVDQLGNSWNAPIKDLINPGTL